MPSLLTRVEQGNGLSVDFFVEVDSQQTIWIFVRHGRTVGIRVGRRFRVWHYRRSEASLNHFVPVDASEERMGFYFLSTALAKSFGADLVCQFEQQVRELR